MEQNFITWPESTESSKFASHRVIKIKLMSPVSVSSGLILSKKISVIKINGATLQITARTWNMAWNIFDMCILTWIGVHICYFLKPFKNKIYNIKILILTWGSKLKFSKIHDFKYVIKEFLLIALLSIKKPVFKKKWEKKWLK